jgi:hypothetical protein
MAAVGFGEKNVKGTTLVGTDLAARAGVAIVLITSGVSTAERALAAGRDIADVSLIDGKGAVAAFLKLCSWEVLVFSTISFMDFLS